MGERRKGGKRKIRWNFVSRQRERERERDRERDRERERERETEGKRQLHCALIFAVVDIRLGTE